jgi:hypothetical protein
MTRKNTKKNTKKKTLGELLTTTLASMANEDETTRKGACDMDFGELERKELEGLCQLGDRVATAQAKLRAFEKGVGQLTGANLVRWNAIVGEYNHATGRKHSKLSYIVSVTEELERVVEAIIKAV